MKPVPRNKPIRIRILSDAREEIDPEALWLDEDIDAEKLIELDPLFDEDLEEVAEQAELENPVIKSLSELGGDSVKPWGVMWQFEKRKLQEKHGNAETAAELACRVKGSK